MLFSHKELAEKQLQPIKLKPSIFRLIARPKTTIFAFVWASKVGYRTFFA
jgi:hypothetical protein